MEPENGTSIQKHPYECVAVTSLSGHTDRVWNVAWNPVQRLLASCSADKTVRMWSYSHKRISQDTSSEEKQHPVSFLPATEIATGHRKTIRSIAWSPSGKNLATASFDSSVSVWERLPGDEEEGESLGEWECVSTLEGHDSECKSVAYSSDGSLIASCSRDKSVWIWEVQPDSDFECLSVLMEHTQDVKRVAWHPTEELLASASYDDNILLYADDPSDDWFAFTTLSGHTSTVWDLIFSPCGSLLASVSDDRTIRIWLRHPTPPVVDANQRVRVRSGSIAAEGQWKIALVIPDAHERSLYSVSWTKTPPSPASTELAASDRGWIATTGGDGHIKVWQINVSEELNVGYRLIADMPDAHGLVDVNCVSWSPLEPGLLASAGDDQQVKIWHVTPTT